MRKLLFILCAMMTTSIFAQFTGKPIYNIRVERDDTLMGNIVVEMFPNIAPNHVANWDSIVMAGGYDSTAFHRVVPGFVIQGGDPNSVSGPTSTWGMGNSSQPTVDAEFSEVPHARGILSAARSSNINSATSQFFICVDNAFSLDNNYTVYGETISGMDIVDLIVAAPRDANDLPFDKISMFITRIGSNDSVPEAPMLTAPTANTTNVTNATQFTWTAVGDAHLYMFEVATDPNFNNIVFSKHTKRLYAFVDGLEDGFTKHYWRVRANNGGKFSLVDEVREFTSGLGVVNLLSPVNGDTDTHDRPLFDWSDGNQVADYRIQVSTSSSFLNPFEMIVDDTVSSSHYQIQPALQILRTHFWRVAAMDASGNMGQFSETFNFRPSRVKGIPMKLAKGLDISPNPFFDEFMLNSPQNGQLKVLNVHGQVVKEVEVMKGDQIINLSQLEEGLYFYSMGQFSGKLIKN